MNLERITWIDSGMLINDEWSTTAVYKKAAKDWTGRVTTVGALVHEDDKVVVLGLSFDTENKHWYGAQLIYKPCIVDRVRLRVRESVKS